MKKNRPYGYIYLIVDCLSDMEYVGQTTQTVKARFDAHYGKNETDIDQAMREYGRENFLVFVLKECFAKEELDEWERRFIFAKGCMAPFGYNQTKGGTGSPVWRHTDEAIEKIRQSKLGEKNPQFGHPHSPEHNRKIGEALKGKLLGRTAPNKGIPMSDEQKKKISVAMTGEKNHQFGNAAVNRCCIFPHLEEAMKEYGDNYPAVARVLGKSYQTIRRRMHGEIDFTDEEKAIIANRYNKPVEYLFARVDKIFC